MEEQEKIKIGTFAKASTGGKIVLDGTRIITEQGMEIGKMFDSDTEGEISAKSFSVTPSSEAIKRSGFEAFWEANKGKVALATFAIALAGFLKIAGLWG
jgi:hypothetical protein